MKLLQFKRVGEGNGDGLIPRMRELLDAHSATFENIAGEDGIGVRKNWQGGITIYGTGAASLSIWSGIVWFGGEIKWDFNRVDNDPQGELSEFGMYGMNGGNYEGSVRGEILKINRNSGSYRWGNFSDEGIFDDINVYEYFPVADQSGRDGIGAQIYVPLAGRTCGDVHLYTNPMRASLFIESATYEEDGESYNVTVSIKGGTWVHRMLASADIKDRDLEISMPVDGDFFCYVYIEGLYEDNLFQAQFGYSSEYPVNASDSLRRCLGKVTLVGAGDPDSYILLERRWAGGDIYTW